MDDNELEGVMAHEMGHVKNYDIRVTMYAFALVAVISILADIILHVTFFSNRDNRSPYEFILAIAAIVIAPMTAGLEPMNTPYLLVVMQPLAGVTV